MNKDFHSDNNSFIFYKDWEEIINCLETDSEVADLFRAIFAFASRGEKAEFKGALKVAYTVIISKIQKDGEKWERTCLSNSVNGKKGGRPKNPNKPSGFLENPNKPNGFSQNPNKPKKPDNEGDSDFDDDNDCDFVNECENDCEKVLKFSPSPPENKFISYGEYKNVLLTEAQYNRLIENFGKEKTAEYIRRVDEYSQQFNRSYSDCDATIRKWIRQDSENDHDNENDSARRSPSFDIAEVEKLMNDKYMNSGN